MALTYQVAEVELVSINGNTYRKVETYAGCDIIQRVNQWQWHYVTDTDELSREFETRFEARSAAQHYRDAVDAAGGESASFTRDVYVAQDGVLRWKGQVTAVSSVPGYQGVLGRVYDPITGVLGDNEFVVSAVSMLPADQLSQAVRDNADAALLALAQAKAAMDAATNTVDTMGGQLESHQSAIHIPRNWEIDNPTRVALSAQLNPGP